MEEFLENYKDVLEKYDEQAARKSIEKITVYNEKITVVFKSGAEIDQII